MADYSALSLAELKEEAKKRGLKGVSTMRKPELIELLSEKDTPAETKKAEVPAVAIPKEEEQAVQERRPMQYQERGQAGGAQGRRPGTASYVQQPRPAYNAQQGGYPQQNRPQ